MRVRILLTPKLCHLLYYSTEAGVHTPASFSCLLNISTVPTFESRQLWITAWHLGRYIVLMQKHFYHICFVSNLLHAKMTFFKINFIDWCVSVTVLLILINFFEIFFLYFIRIFMLFFNLFFLLFLICNYSLFYILYTYLKNIINSLF